MREPDGINRGHKRRDAQAYQVVLGLFMLLFGSAGDDDLKRVISCTFSILFSGRTSGADKY